MMRALGRVAKGVCLLFRGLLQIGSVFFPTQAAASPLTSGPQERPALAGDHRLLLAKGGTPSVLFGGLVLGLSLVFPLVFDKDFTIYPFQAFLLKGFWFQSLLPLFYLVGLTAVLVKASSLWSHQGVPRFLWSLHLVTTTLLILGSGIVLHWALIGPSQDFSTTLIAFALIFWWPAFLVFGMTGLAKKPLAWKVARLTWLSVSLGLMHFLILLSNVLYTKQFQIAWGLWAALLACVILIAGSVKMEQQTLVQEEKLPLL